MGFLRCASSASLMMIVEASLKPERNDKYYNNMCYMMSSINFIHEQYFSKNMFYVIQCSVDYIYPKERKKCKPKKDDITATDLSYNRDKHFSNLFFPIWLYLALPLNYGAIRKERSREEMKL